MKTHLLSLLLALTLVLCGCAPTPTQPEDPSGTAAAETTISSGPEDLKTLSLGGTITALTGSDGLCAVITANDDGTAVLTALEPSAAAVLGQTELPSPYCDFVIYPGGVACWYWETKTLDVYSQALEPLWSRTLSESESGTLQTDGCFYILSADHGVTQLNLSDQSEQHLEIAPELDPIDVLLCRDGRSLLRCSAGLSDLFLDHWIDWDTGEVIPAEHDNANFFLSRAQFYCSVCGSEGTYLFFPDMDDIYLVPSDHPWILCSDEYSALMAEPDNTLIYADLAGKSICRRPTGGISSAVLCGAYVVYSESASPDTLQLWNTDAAETSEDSVQTTTLTDIIAENEALVAQMEADTGMEIFTGEEALHYNDAWPTSYVSDAITDPLSVHLGLLEVARLIRDYPAGIFQEMRPDETTTLQLYLTGPTRGKEQGSSISSAAGFTVHYGKEQIIVLDISNFSNGDALRATLAHELMHMMEQRIYHTSSERGMNYLDYWISFLPDPSLYYYSYHNENGTEITDSAYTAWSDTPMEEVLFLDSYCRTMPTEDIARMMEHLYLGEKSPFAQQLRTGIIAQKAQYLCALIRECYPSCQIEGKLPWEALVETVPFSEYEEAVRNYVSKPLG